VSPVIAQADHASWQRQAAAELARILEGHPELPCIAWTVGPASSVLIGQVSGLAPARRSGRPSRPGGRRWGWASAASSPAGAGHPGCTQPTAAAESPSA
jgi:hypothetical protein